jgi:hypothetical protein
LHTRSASDSLLQPWQRLFPSTWDV